MQKCYDRKPGSIDRERPATVAFGCSKTKPVAQTQTLRACERTQKPRQRAVFRRDRYDLVPQLV